jgi:serine/threonine protein kinase
LPPHRAQETVARFYIAELLLATQELHALGFLHRVGSGASASTCTACTAAHTSQHTLPLPGPQDIKPENIMVGADGHIRLVDFGSSAKLDKSGKASSQCGAQ